jgi:predicted nucleic acid-binding protein
MAAVPHLLDTNTLLRLVKRDVPEHDVVKAAIDHLIGEGADICYTPQNVVEFWNVFTRPREKNGFGLTVGEADRQTSLLENQFTFLPDNEPITHLLTINRTDFLRYRDIIVVHPGELHTST